MFGGGWFNPVQKNCQIGPSPQVGWILKRWLKQPHWKHYGLDLLGQVIKTELRVLIKKYAIDIGSPRNLPRQVNKMTNETTRWLQSILLGILPCMTFDMFLLCVVRKVWSMDALPHGFSPGYDHLQRNIPSSLRPSSNVITVTTIIENRNMFYTDNQYHHISTSY